MQIEMTQQLRKYLKLYKQSEEEMDDKKQEELLQKLEDLYFELNDDEIAYLQEEEII